LEAYRLGKIGECGVQVCRESCGSAKTFQCFYHAWTFDKQGRLIGVPSEDAYSAAFNREEIGLASPPRVEICKEDRAMGPWYTISRGRRSKIFCMRRRLCLMNGACRSG
jgi:Rieske [2Fe-2S] domain